MSGNIHDTHVDRIREEVSSLGKDIKELKAKGEDINDWSSTLQNRYKYLYKTSKTLYNYVVDQYSSDVFDLAFFNNTLEMMLSHISKIQNNDISQNDASVAIGTHLAEEFVPQLKKK
jgi:hypothetical protein